MGGGKLPGCQVDGSVSYSVCGLFRRVGGAEGVRSRTGQLLFRWSGNADNHAYSNADSDPDLCRTNADSDGYSDANPDARSSYSNRNSNAREGRRMVALMRKLWLVLMILALPSIARAQATHALTTTGASTLVCTNTGGSVGSSNYSVDEYIGTLTGSITPTLPAAAANCNSGDRIIIKATQGVNQSYTVTTTAGAGTAIKIPAAYGSTIALPASTGSLDDRKLYQIWRYDPAPATPEWDMVTQETQPSTTTQNPQFAAIGLNTPAAASTASVTASVNQASDWPFYNAINANAGGAAVHKETNDVADFVELIELGSTNSSYRSTTIDEGTGVLWSQGSLTLVSDASGAGGAGGHIEFYQKNADTGVITDDMIIGNHGGVYGVATGNSTDEGAPGDLDFQHVFANGNQLGWVGTATYGATVKADLSKGNTVFVTVTDANSWELLNPIGGPSGIASAQPSSWKLDIFCNHSPNCGAITLDGVYKTDGTLAEPANGKRKVCNVTMESTDLVLITGCSADIS